MLSPEDRKLYSATFAAPANYVFDCGVATTYSLDLDSLLFAQFCLATSGAGEPEQALRDPVGLLEAIHRTGDRVTVFCQAGETNVPEQPHALYALLERSLVPARAAKPGGVFHPKLWVLRFRERDSGEVRLRVVVLSRNLTRSRAWDSFVCLEGSPGRKRESESQDLADLLRTLPDLALERPAATRLSQMERLAREVERCTFDAPLPFEGVASFLAVGIGLGRTFRPSESADRLLAISPFVSHATLDALRPLAPEAQLISRPEEMAKCPAETIAAWQAHTLDEAASASSEAAEEDSGDRTAEVPPEGLHAKALAFETRKRTTWWLGSGNLTDAVRDGTNVELMLRLEGKTSKVGIDAFLEGGFKDLLQDYRHSPPPEDLQAGNRSAVERAKQALASAGLELRCEDRDGSWDLVLLGTAALPEGVTASCRPITLPPSRAQTFGNRPAEHCFSQVTMESLTALIAFHLSAGRGDAHYETHLTLKLPISGLPSEREARISRAIISDRSAFLNYLRSLLAGLGGLPLDGGSSTKDKKRPGDPAGGGSLFASGLLEQMLRALHEEPERLRGIRSLLERAETLQNDADSPIPTEFRELWKAIEPHLPDWDASAESGLRQNTDVPSDAAAEGDLERTAS